MINLNSRLIWIPLHDYFAWLFFETPVTGYVTQLWCIYQELVLVSQGR